MSLSLAESFDYCRRLTRRRARNFYYSFLLLGRDEHDAMCAVYAFMRYCDDLSDEPAAGAGAEGKLEEWRSDMEAALSGAFPAHPVWPAFRATVERYQIPRRYFHDMVDGVSSDLFPGAFETFEDLYRYCYRVASVVGLTVIRILGCESPEADALAEKCGVAFQLTNILRDVKEDAGRGRVYLPEQDLARFGMNRADLIAGRGGEEFRRLMRFEAARARSYYEDSAPLVGMAPRRNRAPLWALIEIYRRLLVKIERSGFDVLRRRISLSPLEKCCVLLRALLRSYGR